MRFYPLILATSVATFAVFSTAFAADDDDNPIKKAMKLNDDGVKVPKEKKPLRKPLPLPKEFASALKKAKGAAAKFDGFSPSHKREYIEWIIEAKTDETRQRRLTTAVEWIAAGKSRNWKYERK